MLHNQSISYYTSVTDKKGMVKTIQQVIELISTVPNSFAPHISKLRKETNQKEKDKIKKYLPAVTWSGLFEPSRLAKNLKQYTGLICVDIDKLPSSDELRALKEKLKSDPFTYFIFTSPSGNGLKVLVQVSGGPEKHLSNFLALEQYYFSTYGISIDPSGKDVSRLCFLSADMQDFYWEQNSKVFNVKDEVPAKVIKQSEKKKQQPQYTPKQEKEFTNSEDTLDNVKDFTDKLYQFTEGNRNNYIFIFSANANRKGFDISETLDYITGFAGDMDIKEISATVASAYNHNSHEHGKYKKQVKKPSLQKETGSRKGSNGNGNTTNDVQQSKNNSKRSLGKEKNSNQEEEETFIQFWYETVEEKNGKEIRKYYLKYNELIDFLSDAGFYRLPLIEGRYQFIHYKNNICKPVTHLHMKDYVFQWLQNNNYKEVLEMMRRGAKSYFIPQVLEGLPYKLVEFKRDTADAGFFYFKNCFVKVTAEKITTHDYKELDGAVWESSLIEKDFTLNNTLDYTSKFTEQETADELLKCEFFKFLVLVSHNVKNDPPADALSNEEKMKLDELHYTKYKSLCTALGYLLHGYKNPSNAKAIVAVDHKIADRGEQNGGTGKSLLGTYAIKSMKKVATIPGKEFREENAWKYEPITIDSQIVFFNDVKYNFVFESVFELITDDMVINRRNIGYLVIPFNQSPKLYITTNFVLKGDGSSFKRRIHIIEFDDYFNDEHTPYDEFGHNLFTDSGWDAHQWNCFYNAMMQYLQWYFLEGLVKYPGSNYEVRKLMAECPTEFLDWMDATNDKGVHLVSRNVELVKKDIMKQYNEYAGEYGLQKVSAHLFSKWVKKYCITKKLTLNPHKEGRPDKRNGVEYYVIADENYKELKPKQVLPTIDLFSKDKTN